MHFLEENLATRSRWHPLSCAIFEPHLIDNAGDSRAQDSARLLRFRSVESESAVEQRDVGRHLCKLRALRIVCTLRGGDQQPEDKSGHRPNKSHTQLDHVFRLGSQMMARQKRMRQETCERSAKEMESPR